MDKRLKAVLDLIEDVQSVNDIVVSIRLFELNGQNTMVLEYRNSDDDAIIVRNAAFSLDKLGFRTRLEGASEVEAIMHLKN